MISILPVIFLPSVLGLLGGTDVSSPVPYLVMIYDEYFGYQCGGTIVSLRCIITAAKCIIPFVNNYPDLKVIVDYNNDFGEFKEYKVDKIILRDDYNRQGQNDLSVVCIQDKFIFSDNVRPVRFPNSRTEGGRNLVVTSYGSSDLYDIDVDKLKMLNMTSITKDECNAYYENKGRTIEDGQICALAIQPNSDVCRSDTGCPLLDENTIVGITSIARCANQYPSIFTDVFPYADWIRINSGLPVRPNRD